MIQSTEGLWDVAIEAKNVIWWAGFNAGLLVGILATLCVVLLIVAVYKLLGEKGLAMTAVGVGILSLLLFWHRPTAAVPDTKPAPKVEPDPKRPHKRGD